MFFNFKYPEDLWVIVELDSTAKQKFGTNYFTVTGHLVTNTVWYDGYNWYIAMIHKVLLEIVSIRSAAPSRGAQSQMQWK